MAQFTLSLDNWPWIILGLVNIYVARFFVRFYKHRRFYSGLPTPPHSMLLGNLKVMGDAMKNYPSDFHPQSLFADMAKDYGFRGLFYVDLYPATESFLFILDPALAMQIQDSPHFKRHTYVEGYLRGIIGTKSLFSIHGAEWKRQRAWFSPAFSMSHLLTLVPGIVEETLVFREKLTKHAISGDILVTNDATTRLTIDVIARSVGDIRLKSQSEHSDIFYHFMKAVNWTAGNTAPIWHKLMSSRMMDYHTSRLDRLLGGVIKRKFQNTTEDGVSKSILDLALKGYSKDNGRVSDQKASRADLDPEFMKMALDNAKLFMAGGHDTTASLITFTLYELSINPNILSRVRAEHNEVFGTTLESSLQALSVQPALINNLPLTHAVLKEVLRLHPVGFTVREGAPGATIRFEGRDYPTHGHMISPLTTILHRDPAIWGDNSAEFDPDRFLDPKRHDNAAWQPFEKGPRNCIGQQLALIETKVIAVLVLRFFDFEAAFKEHGLSIPDYGGRAYQELKLTAKPKDGIPMRVRIAK